MTTSLPLPDELLATLPPTVFVYLRALETVAATVAATLATQAYRFGTQDRNRVKDWDHPAGA